MSSHMICLKCKAKAQQQQNGAATRLAPEAACEVYLLPVCLSSRHAIRSSDKAMLTRKADKAMLTRQCCLCKKLYHARNSTNSTRP